MKALKSKFLQHFLAVAQPYWYPNDAGGKTFLVLLFLTVIFGLGNFFVAVGAFSLIGQQYFPKLLSYLTPGLPDMVTQVINSPAINLIRLFCIIPIIGFCYYWRQLRYHFRAWSMLALLLFLLLSVSGMNVVGSYVGRDLVTAIAHKNHSEYFRLLFIYAWVLVVTTVVVVFSQYVRKKLAVNWVEWLTNYFLQQYFRNRAYYHISYQPDIDNPDQRISSELLTFTQTSISVFLTLFNQIIDLIVFCGILWSISKLLVAVLVIYALFGNLVTTVFSQRLILLNHNQLQCEADFRYGLLHIRNNAESIAFYGGEEQEASQVKRRFIAAIQNTKLMIGWQRNMEFFTTGYSYLIMIIPYLLVAPLYLEGKIELGVITQAAIACNQVLGALSIIVGQFESLSTYAAVINRLGNFWEALVAHKAKLPGTANIELVTANHLSLEHFTLQTPNYERTLVKDLSVAIADGDRLLIMGDSGCGKSSLLRALAGLWNAGNGVIVRPNLADMMFLPQRPYMILGSLRDQLLYPKNTRDITDKELYQVLARVHLEDLPLRVGDLDAELDWDDVLSLGEQQRIAFARLLLMRPRYAILDEATSALDLKNEEHLYQQLQQTDITFISVGHRSSLIKYHHLLLQLRGDDRWQLVKTQQTMKLPICLSHLEGNDDH